MEKFNNTEAQLKKVLLIKKALLQYTYSAFTLKFRTSSNER